MMLTPCWPNAGPTGGAGFAWPAAICSLICPVIFFAMFFSLFNRSNVLTSFKSSTFLHLPIFQFHGRIPPENIHGDLQFSAFGLNFFNHAAEIKEWTVVDLHRLTDIKAHLWLLMLFRCGNLVLNRFHFL